MKKLLIVSILLLICSVSFAQLSYPVNLENCVGYWTFNSSDLYATDVFQDMSGNDNNGTSANTPVYGDDQNGIGNQSMLFNGSSDYVTVTGNSDLRPELITISYWLNANDISDPHCIIMNEDTYSTKTGYTSFVQSNFVRLDLGDGTNFHRTRYSITDYVNTWLHIVFTYDGTTQLMYINGVKVDDDSWSGVIDYNADKNVDFGIVNNHGSYKFDGSLSDILIYTTALTEDEVMQLYLAGQNTARMIVAGSGTNVATNDLQKGLILDMPLCSPYTAQNDSIVKDCTPYSNDGTVEGATLKHDGLVNAGDGIAYINQDKAYGTFTFDVNKGADENTPYYEFISDVSTSFPFNGYYFVFTSDEAIRLYRRTGHNSDILFYSADSYITINTDYRIKITRSLAGVFTMYIKGGTFGWDDWTTVSTAGGSGTNPVTDNTYTTSNYLVVDLDNTDTISNLKIDGKRISLANAVQSTGTWTLTGDAYSFITDDYISITDTDDLSFGDGTNDSPFSISAWVNMADATNFAIASKGVYNTDAEWKIDTAQNDKIYFYVMDESVDNCYRGRFYNTAVLDENTWIHLVGTYSGVGGTDAEDGMNIYLNGVAVDDTDLKAGTYVAMENLDSDVLIGRYSTTYANGQIADIKIWGKELSSTEVLQIYQSEIRRYQ